MVFSHLQATASSSCQAQPSLWASHTAAPRGRALPAAPRSLSALTAACSPPLRPHRLEKELRERRAEPWNVPLAPHLDWVGRPQTEAGRVVRVVEAPQGSERRHPGAERRGDAGCARAGRTGARPRAAARGGLRGAAAGRGGEPGLGGLPAGPAAAPPPPPPPGPAGPGGTAPPASGRGPISRRPPPRPALSPSGDRKSAQQMRKWQAGRPWGLLSGPAPSEPSATARLAPAGESRPPRAGPPRARAPAPAGPPGPALPCPAQAVGEAVPGARGWEVPALWGWASPAASLPRRAPLCLTPGLPPPAPALAPLPPLSPPSAWRPCAPPPPPPFACLPFPSIPPKGRKGQAESPLGTHPDMPRTWGEVLPGAWSHL